VLLQGNVPDYKREKEVTKKKTIREGVVRAKRRNDSRGLSAKKLLKKKLSMELAGDPHRSVKRKERARLKTDEKNSREGPGAKKNRDGG